MLNLIVDLFSLNNKYVVYNFIVRNLKLKYRKSYFGVFWTILIPAAMALVYYFVFQRIIKVQIDNYLVFLLCGILPWGFFSSALTLALESVVGNYNLLSKVPIAPSVFPLSEVLSAFLNFILALPVFFIVFFFSDLSLTVNVFFVPCLLGMLFLQAYFWGLLAATIFVFLRDLRHIMVVLLQILFYATPILYHASMIPEKYRWILFLNPIGSIFDGLHRTIHLGVAVPNLGWAAASTWTMVSFVMATICYFRVRRTLVERI